MYLPYLNLSRVWEIVYLIIRKSVRDRIEESKNGWYEHKKVELVEIFYKMRKHFKILTHNYERVSFTVLIRN